MSNVRDEFNTKLQTVLEFLGKDDQLIWDIYWCMSLQQAEQNLSDLMEYHQITLEDVKEETLENWMGA